MQTRGGPVNLESTETAHSHDSAIDSGNWENEPNDVSSRLMRVTLALPRQYDVGVELGCYVKHSNAPGVNVGDRLIAVDDVIVHDKTIDEVRRQLARNAGLRLQLIRHLPPQKSTYSAASSHDELLKTPPDRLLAQQKYDVGDVNGQSELSNVWTGDNARVRLRPKRQVIARVSCLCLCASFCSWTF